MGRRLLGWAAVATVAIGCGGLSPFPTGVSSERDHYSNVERLQVGFGSVYQHPDLRGGLGLSVVTSSRAPGLATFAFKSFTDTQNGWRYLQCESVDVLADGASYRFPLERESVIGKPSTSGVPASMVELLAITMPWERAVTILQAKSLDVRLCQTDIRGVKLRPALVATFIERRGQLNGGAAPSGTAAAPTNAGDEGSTVEKAVAPAPE